MSSMQMLDENTGLPMQSSRNEDFLYRLPPLTAPTKWPSKLAAIGAPFCQGHVQGYDIGTKQFATGNVIRGIVAGSFYIHDEPYKGQANKHDRCCVVLNEVNNGRFSEMPLTMDYLCRKFEGTSLARYLQRKYRNAKQRFSVANV